VKYRFEQCLQRGKTVRIPVNCEQVVKELREAEQDLTAAEHSLEWGDRKVGNYPGLLWRSSQYSRDLDAACQVNQSHE